MGVYIDMEMPDKCGHCRFATAFECEVTKNFITTFNVRQVDCPLVPVPRHGRLIDADALISRCVDEKGCYYGHDSAVIGEAVESAPTIIPAEEAAP